MNEKSAEHPQKKLKIVVTGGGTAGHVWPNFALFDSMNSPLKRELNAGNLEVHYFGSHTGLEHDLVTTTMPSWHYHSIATGKLRRYFSIKNIFDPFRVILGFLQAFLNLRKIKPFALFSKGGFVSAPVVWAAWLNRIPVVIHESDATPALATKLTMPFARKILFAFPDSTKHLPKIFQKKASEVGLPLRASLFGISNEEGRAHFQFQNTKNVVLIFGGSLGARQLNKNIVEVLPTLCERYNIIHITGKGNASEFSHPDYRQFEFLKDDMKFAYAAANLAVCRAGASSIFELLSARIPMILIPLGLSASRGDQIINAQIFVQKGWAESFEESKFTGNFILEAIDKNFQTLKEKQNVLNAAPEADSATHVASLLFEFRNG